MIHYNRTYFYNRNYIHYNLNFELIASSHNFLYQSISCFIPIPWLSSVIQCLDLFFNNMESMYFPIHTLAVHRFLMECATFKFFFFWKYIVQICLYSSFRVQEKGANNWPVLKWTPATMAGIIKRFVKIKILNIGIRRKRFEGSLKIKK